MKILISALSEHAWVEGGCLSLCRSFDTVTAQKFPFKLPRLSIALRLLIGRSEAGGHILQVTMVDSDGKKLMNSNIKMNIKAPPDNIPESSFSAVINGQNIVFQKSGDYVVNVLIDGRISASIPLYIREKTKK